MKVLFTFLFLACFHLAAFAQAPRVFPVAKPFKPGYTVGIKGGLNFASVSALDGSAMYLGWHGGGFGEFRPLEKLGYSAELLFTNQGVTINDIDFGLNYVSLPVGLNIYAGRAAVQGGGYAAVLLKANSRQFLEKQNITGNFSGTDLGLYCGIKLQTTERLSAGLRFSAGLQNINEGFVNDRGATLYNRNVQFSIGYGF